MDLSVVVATGPKPAGPDKRAISEMLSLVSDTGATTQLTGVLLCINGSVWAVLEGPRGVLFGIVKRFSSGERTRSIEWLGRNGRFEREFKDWRTGIVSLRETPAETRARLDKVLTALANNPSLGNIEALSWVMAP